MYDVGRATRDLDGIFAPSAELRAITARLGTEEDLQPDWLNDAAKGSLPGNDPERKAAMSAGRCGSRWPLRGTCSR